MRIGSVYWAVWLEAAPHLYPWEPSQSFGWAPTVPAAKLAAQHELVHARRLSPVVAEAAYAYADAAHRRGASASAAHQAYSQRRTMRGRAATPKAPRAAPSQGGSATNRAGSYWIARMVADMCGAPPPDPGRWGFTEPPPRPPWAEPRPETPPVAGAAAPAELAKMLAVLGLLPGATVVQVRRAYRKLALEHHPDRGGEEAAFIRCTDAFATAIRLMEQAAAPAP